MELGCWTVFLLSGLFLSSKFMIDWLEKCNFFVNTRALYVNKLMDILPSQIRPLASLHHKSAKTLILYWICTLYMILRGFQVPNSVRLGIYPNHRDLSASSWTITIIVGDFYILKNTHSLILGCVLISITPFNF